MKLVINIPKEAVMMAASFIKMEGEGDCTNLIEESDSLSVELSDEDLKTIVGKDYAMGMMGLAGFALTKEKERRENESKSN